VHALSTSFGDASDQLFESTGIKFANGDVVEQEERFGADAREVVNQHRHQVDAHRVVAPNLTRDLKLGAHAVGGGDEHRLFVLRGVEREEAAKATNAAQNFRSFRTGNDILDPANCSSPASIDTPALA